MADTITYTGRLVVEYCCACGIAFAMPLDLQQRRRNDHQTFYCPAGHGQHYTGESDEERLRRQLKAERNRRTSLTSQLDQERARADHEMARRRGYQGALAKARRRVGRGQCPACETSFPDLASHMAEEHPDYAGSEEGDDVA